MCGGSGTRLFPLSRKLLPKQFLKLTDKNLSMFQLTVKRAIMNNINHIYVVSNIKHNFMIREQMEELKVSYYTIISEPFGKDTCAAITSASLISNAQNILVMSSDHVWEDNIFSDVVMKAVDINKSVTVFGIVPTYPETGYGYIEHDGNKLIKFVEKPDMVTAKEYIHSKKYLWNSGNFIFNREFLIEKLKLTSNDILLDVKSTINASKKFNNEIILNKDIFEKVRSISIDYAVMEHVTDGNVIQYTGYWSDIGSFKSLHMNKKKDNSSNYIDATNMSLSTTNSMIMSDNKDKLILTNNIRDLTIIDTRDCLYIGNIDSSQDVKKLVNNIKAEENNTIKEMLNVHTKAYRPWGWYINVEGKNEDGFKIKRIGVYPGKRLSLQSHKHRSEHWVIVKGTARVQVGEDQLILHKNQHVYIPVGVLHRMENIGEDMVEFVETQIGNYLGEDDIVRYQDDFGRV